ncbi:hypothetical protein [Paraburkholderia fungorum]|mgnify:FL=1|uniref:Uncharacterized protein n=1 Tax=Paraburkholderia fungorum TaxID=134537 RepID=A0AAW3UT64_9BURK|nr:hypothetical protein [Paraburkholderia fungorum]KFX60526.1 hypothetical protein KBK24_0137690 [Burkholderia sp. K24]AJZ62997.1 hypothetical protein OI25_5500 [Paraburkholderia fungorum]MBB4513040.1 hypothetical protein [Paraburkholderia fungorum]MBB5540769.1 hypothetical protein [Paraburkholderia fungorum]MBB6201533.1 hypothetical protein [Paraburkholderia fungorum]
MFKPYSNDDDVLNIQGDALTVSNGTARVVLNGTLELTRDQRGLKAALALKEAIDAVVAALQAQADLPAKVKDEPDAKPGVVQNPFQ